MSVAGGQDHSVVATDQGNLYTFGSLGAHLGYSNASQTLSPRLIRSGSANEASCKVVAGDKCTFVVTNALPSFVPKSSLVEEVSVVRYLPYPKHYFCLSKNPFIETPRFRVSVDIGSACLKIKDYVSGSSSLPAIDVCLRCDETRHIVFQSSRKEFSLSLSFIIDSVGCSIDLFSWEFNSVAFKL